VDFLKSVPDGFDERAGQKQERTDNKMSVQHEDNIAGVYVQDYRLVWFEPLTDREIKRAAAEWLEFRLEEEKQKPRTQRIPRARLKMREPFKTGVPLYPYMPGGLWCQ